MNAAPAGSASCQLRVTGMDCGVVTASPLAFLIVVETCGVFALMTRGSDVHALVAPTLKLSPL